MTWTAEADENLRQWTQEGVSAKDQAMRLGVSRNAVLGRRFRLGICTAPQVKSEIMARARMTARRARPVVKKPAPGAVSKYSEAVVKEAFILMFVTGNQREAARMMGISHQNLRPQAWFSKYAHLLPESRAEAESRLDQMRRWEEAGRELERFRKQERIDASLKAIRENTALTSRQAMVLERRVKGDTLEAIAADFGVTRERIRQIEAAGAYHTGPLYGVMPSEAEMAKREPSRRLERRAQEIMAITAAKAVDLPKTPGEARIAKLKEMEPGESFCIPFSVADRAYWTNAAKAAGLIITTRKTDEGLRIWRVQ